MPMVAMAFSLYNFFFLFQYAHQFFHRLTDVTVQHLGAGAFGNFFQFNQLALGGVY